MQRRSIWLVLSLVVVAGGGFWATKSMLKPRESIREPSSVAPNASAYVAEKPFEPSPVSAADRRSLSVRTIVVRESGQGDPAPPPLSGQLVAYRLGERGVTREHQAVTLGRAVINDSELEHAQAPLYFTSFLDQAGVEYPIASGELMPATSVLHEVEVFVEREWIVDVVDALDGTPLRDIEVSFVDDWFHAAVIPSEPPLGAQRFNTHPDRPVLTSGVRRVYWLRADGYAWKSFEWERRVRIGQRVELGPLGRIAVRCECGSHNLEVTAVATGGQREVWSAMSGEPGPPLESGRWHIRMAWGGADPELYAQDQLTVSRDVTEAIAPCSRSVRQLEVKARGYQDVASVKLHRMDLWREGSTGAIAVDSEPIILRSEAGWSLLWDSLSPATYVVCMPDGVFLPADLTFSDSIIIADRGQNTERILHFVEQETGLPVTAKWVRWTVIAGGLPAFPDTLLPETGLDALDLDTLLIKAPPGEVRYVIDAGSGAVTGSCFVQEGDVGVEVRVSSRFAVRLTGVPAGVPRSWIEDVQLLRHGAPLPTRVSRGTRSRDTWGVVFAASRPDYIVIPQELGAEESSRVIAVPSYARSARVDFTGAVAFE